MRVRFRYQGEPGVRKGFLRTRDLAEPPHVKQRVYMGDPEQVFIVASVAWTPENPEYDAVAGLRAP